MQIAVGEADQFWISGKNFEPSNTWGLVGEYVSQRNEKKGAWKNSEGPMEGEEGMANLSWKDWGLAGKYKGNEG